MPQTKIEKAREIYSKFSHLPSAQVKAKIAKQCKMTDASASSYYYTCKGTKPISSRSASMTTARKTAKKARKSSGARR